MQKIKCILWDLDETLLDTSRLREYRDSLDWKKVRQNFGLVKEYGSLLSIYNELNDKYYSAIVTSSPKWYAEKLLKTYQINSNIFLSFGATGRRKPHPDPFLRAMKMLRVKKDECIAIGDSEKDCMAAKNCPIKFIGVTWGETSKSKFAELGAEYIISKPKELIKLFSI